MKSVSFKSKVLAVLAIAAISVSITGCSKEEMSNPATGSSNDVSLSRQAAPTRGTQPIAQIAINGGFTQLVAALSYVDTALNMSLVNMFMNGTDQHTVFAPTDSAFQNLYTALGVTQITDLPATLVRDVLLYHVIDGRRAANSVVPRTGTRNIATLLGAHFTVNPQGQITAIGNTANITSANISASNGIIHVIDAVILPQ